MSEPRPDLHAYIQRLEHQLISARAHADEIRVVAKQQRFRAEEAEGRLASAREALQETISFAGHAHWDYEGTRGANCSLCIARRQWLAKYEHIWRLIPPPTSPLTMETYEGLRGGDG
jgi:hypothetical protein